MTELIRTMLLVAVLTVHLRLWKTLDVDPDELDPDDLRSFSDIEVEELNTAWEPPPGDRHPSRKEFFKEWDRVARWRWRSEFGKEGESWQFGGPRGARTAADWDKLPDNQRTLEVFEGLTHAAKVELMDRGLDPTTLEPPAPASEEGEGALPAESEPITEDNVQLVEPDDEMFAWTEEKLGNKNKPLLDRLDAGEFDEVGLDRERVALLRELTTSPEGTRGRGEAVQRLNHLLTTAADLVKEPAPFIPVETRTRNLGPKGVVVTQRDSLGRTREVVRMTSEEVAQALAQEEQDTAADADFGANPLAVAISEFQTWSPERRRLFLEKHPAEFNALADALSLEAER